VKNIFYKYFFAHCEHITILFIAPREILFRDASSSYTCTSYFFPPSHGYEEKEEEGHEAQGQEDDEEEKEEVVLRSSPASRELSGSIRGAVFSDVIRLREKIETISCSASPKHRRPSRRGRAATDSATPICAEGMSR
jgi:hypothetical protein